MSATASRRPAPRRSSLAGSTPTTPPQPAPAPAPAQPVAPMPNQAPHEAASTGALSPGPQMGVAARRGKYPPKVSFYQDPADTARVRGAILHTMVTEGPRTLSQFIDRAVMAEVARLEATYNSGQPFPPVAARQLPQGRPLVLQP